MPFKRILIYNKSKKGRKQDQNLKEEKKKTVKKSFNLKDRTLKWRWKSRKLRKIKTNEKCEPENTFIMLYIYMLLI